jgi:hypothetical protein
MHYTIDNDRKLVVSTAYPTVHYEDVLQHQRALLMDHNFRPDFSQLADFSTVKEMTLTNEHLMRLAKRDIFAPGSRRAAYAPCPIAFGVLRVFVAFRKIYSVPNAKGEFEMMHVFDDRRMALGWLMRELDMLPLVAA